jgi:hypothetical protein
MAARQVGGTVRQDGNRIAIVPGPRDLASVLKPPSTVLVRKLREALVVSKPIAKAPLKDVTEFFDDKCDVTIVVDDWALSGGDRAKSVLDVKCDLPAGTRPVQAWLEQLAGQVRGRVVARDERVVLIVPQAQGGAGLPAPGRSVDVTVRDLQRERLAVLQQVAGQLAELYQRGRGSVADILAAQKAALQAELELCATDSERLAVLGRLVAVAKQIEKFESDRSEAAGGDRLGLLRARANRLEAEIALAKAREARPR